MKGENHKIFLATFAIYAIPFAIIVFTDCLVRINSKK